MQKKQKKVVWITLILLSVLTALILIFSISPSPKNKKQRPVIRQEEFAEPKFRKDGELKFIQNKKILQKILIEVADNDMERTQGLMYRKSMPDTCGMLFIFETMQPLSFWMKNTHIPLDIIYIDNDFNIVSIAANTTPFSEISIPSGKDAQYVVEVNAGFCQRNKVVAGTKIVFTLN